MILLLVLSAVWTVFGLVGKRVVPLVLGLAFFALGVSKAMGLT